MKGLITMKDVLANPVTIVRGFGIGCLFRCFRAAAVSAVTGKPCTFLSCI